MRSLVVAVCLSLFTVKGVLADQAQVRLDRFFTNVTTLEGRFFQEVFDEEGRSFQQSSGSVKLARPGRFRWEYETPYPQLILADGKDLWIYDEDLAQATVKPLEEALGTAPIMLLTHLRPLNEEFVIRDSSRRQGLDWVKLVPKVKDTEFQQIELGLDKKTIRQMELHDQFGQKTVIRFEGVETNGPIPQSVFDFNVPPGVDVIGGAE